jgi:phosphatidylserine/phosphatidylglycerophosphate/cardiolipin synthase-like enzyme
VRNSTSAPPLTVKAVSGSYVVLLGFDMDEADCDELAGFGIERTDHQSGAGPRPLLGMKSFKATSDVGRVNGGYSTLHHPIQGFGWSDYDAEPGHDYTYRVVALKGPPDGLQRFAEASVDISTEAPEGGDHDIYFNRGVAASQAYRREFNNRRPDDVGPPAFEWLSRGMAEAIQEFIGRATDSRWGVRVAAYEFTDPAVLTALKAALDREVDVQVVYDHRGEKPGDKNAEAIEAHGLGDVCTPREEGRSYIAHNKFIVLTHDGEAQAVLTGGTNFSTGGIYGHSNVIHVVEDPAIAGEYLDYWTLLQGDPTNKALKPKLSAKTIPDGLPPSGTMAVFSPRKEIDALEYYAALANKAKDGLFATFAFGMSRIFQGVYETSQAPLRFATMETEIRPMKKGPDRDEELERIRRLRAMEENKFAIGSHLTGDGLDGWLSERLTELNSHVRYIHNKFMLVDPLSDDPIVVAGSANFSTASSIDNDENMLVIRGNKRVADIYLGEFMRMYAHHAFRNFIEREGGSADFRNLDTGEWWHDYFGSSTRSRQRAYFSGVNDAT